MLKTGIVQVTARGTDVAFVIDEEASFDVVAAELRDYLAKQNGLWSKGDITVNVGQRMLARDELAQLKSIIETSSGLKVTRFWCSPDALDSGDFKIEAKKTVSTQPTYEESRRIVHNEVLAPKPPLRTRSEPEAPEFLKPKSPSRDSLPSVEVIIEDLKTRQNKNGADNKNRTDALLIKSTFRSGESVHHPGDVVVLGDVNPGSEIRADGDIVVLGSLKGLAHAGASGDNRCVIIASDLLAARVQIAKYQGIAPTSAPGKAKSLTSGIKIAFVRSRSIHVADYAGRFARYSKGVPYDG